MEVKNVKGIHPGQQLGLPSQFNSSSKEFGDDLLDWLPTDWTCRTTIALVVLQHFSLLSECF